MDSTSAQDFNQTFVETSAYESIRYTIDFGMKMSGGSVITCRATPDMAKTHSRLKIQDETPRSAYIEVTQASKNTSGLAKAIIKACVSLARGKQPLRFSSTIPILARRDINSLSDNIPPVLLIIDEAQTLELATLRELLFLQKQSECVLVICGNHGRLAETRPAQANSALMEQIESRISWRVVIDGPTDDDFALVAQKFGLTSGPEMDLCIRIGMATNLRIVSKLLHHACTANPFAAVPDLTTLERLAPHTIGRSAASLKAAGLFT